MKIMDAIEVMNERKTTAFLDPNHEQEGMEVESDEYRKLLIGLDLDMDELIEVGNNFVALMLSLWDRVETARLLRTAVVDALVAGVYYERNREKVD